MRTIAHISDLHFGVTSREVEKKLLEDLAREKPSLIVISGDLTQRALRKQFRRARLFLEKLESPFLVIPGNHDIPSLDITRRFLLPLYRYKNYISYNLNPTFVDEEMEVCCINTASSWKVESGRISKKQLQSTRHFFYASKKHTMRIVVTHHPFLRPPGMRTLRKLVTPAKKALEVFSVSDVDLILCGHFHRSHAVDVRETYHTLPSSIIHAQAGSALGKRTPGSTNNYNFIKISHDKIIISLRAWNGKEFAHTGHTTFVREGKNWESMKTKK